MSIWSILPQSSYAIFLHLLSRTPLPLPPPPGRFNFHPQLTTSTTNSNRPRNTLPSLPDPDALDNPTDLLHQHLRRPVLHRATGLVRRVHVPRGAVPPAGESVVRLEYSQRYVSPLPPPLSLYVVTRYMNVL